MQALRWTAVNEMSWVEEEKPSVPEGWVRVQTLMVGVCGSEVSAYQGHNELRRPPLIMGHEFSARLLDDAPEVGLSKQAMVTVNPLISCGTCRHCRQGQRQLCASRQIIGIDFSGAFGEVVAVPPRQCYAVNDPAHGAMVEPLACAVRAINQADVTLGDTVLVIGAGIIGLMAAQVARAGGAMRVILVDTNGVRLHHGYDWGATDLVDASTQDVASEVRRMVPEGVDRVVDAVGYGATRAHAIDLVRRGGRVVFIGLHENESTIPGNAIVRDEVEICGSFCYTDEEFRTAVSLANAGFLDRAGDWLNVRAAEDGNAAFQEQSHGSARFAKILLQLG